MHRNEIVVFLKDSERHLTLNKNTKQVKVCQKRKITTELYLRPLENPF